MKKKLKPVPRAEHLPVPVPVSDSRTALAERVPVNAPHGHPEWGAYAGQAAPNNGYGPHGATYAPPAPAPAMQPSYFQILFQQIKKRWRLLAVWMAVSIGMAAVVVVQFGKPSWKAEGNLYYSPDYNYSSKRLYTPPNIQTVLALCKAPENLERARIDLNLPIPADAMQPKLTVAIVKQSDLISVSFEWADKETAEAVANRVMQLAIEQTDRLRKKLSKQAIDDLHDSLEKVQILELAKRSQLNETLGRKNIFDLKTEASAVINQIASLEDQIRTARSEKDRLQSEVKSIDDRVKALIHDLGMSDNTLMTSEELSLYNYMRDIQEKRRKRLEEIEQAKVKLKAKEEQYRILLPLARTRNVTPIEMAELLAEINSLKVIVQRNSDLQEMEQSIKEMEQRILNVKKGTGSIPLTQVRMDKMKLEAQLDSFPFKISSLDQALKERKEHQLFIQRTEREEGLPLQQQIEALQTQRNALTQQKHDHEKLETNKMGELTVYTPASAGFSPASSNHTKLAVTVVGLSLLLFVGFVAFRDMPRVMPPVPASATPPYATAVPGPYLPLPPWQQHQALPPPPPQPPALPAQRNPAMNNEHLRALAERIEQNISEAGSIILFTPTAQGLRVENLLGDLGCFLKADFGKVLVFEARTEGENPSYPAWTGPSSREVGEQLEAYLEGRHERAAPCFAETLISSIHYARGDLSRHLTGVMAMYRFRRLMQEMKQRYSVVLMITPERYPAEEDDVFTTLGEGIVVVINEDADPEDVEEYLRDLRASETPVYGAVTVPPQGP